MVKKKILTIRDFNWSWLIGIDKKKIMLTTPIQNSNIRDFKFLIQLRRVGWAKMAYIIMQGTATVVVFKCSKWNITV